MDLDTTPICKAEPPVLKMPSHPWRAALIGSIAGYFAFAVVLQGLSQISGSTRIQAHGLMLIGKVVLLGVGYGLIGLIVVIGWVPLLTAVLAARGMLASLSAIGRTDRTAAFFGGLLVGPLLGLVASLMVFGEVNLQSILAGATTGPFIALLTRRLAYPR